MRIALVQCPMFNVRMPQLGPAYLKSILEKNGHQVKQFDFNIDLYNSVDQDYKRYWDYDFEPQWTKNRIDCSWEDIQTIKDIPFISERLLENWAEDIIKSGVDLIGFTVYYTSVNLNVLLARKIKKLDRSKRIIFGGPFIMSYLDISRDRIVNINIPICNILDIIDMVTVGEGEETILEVIKRLENENTMKGCQGIIAKENGSLVVNNPRPLIKDLNSLPFPGFSILDSHTYTDKNFLPILANRGCPNRCAFCDFPYLDRYKFRMRRVKNVINEIKCQMEKYGTDFFHFNDSAINANIKFVSEMCDLIIKEGISIRWGASASIDARMDRYFFDKLKKAGCEYLSLGIESASVQVLHDMRKFSATKDIKRNIVDCHDAGISIGTNWIIGYFTEKDEDFEQTLNFITENVAYIDEIDAALFSLKPHTYVYDNREKLGICLDKNFMWYTRDNRNNYEVRLKRLERFRQLQENLGTKINNRIGGLREQ